MFKKYVHLFWMALVLFLTSCSANRELQRNILFTITDQSYFDFPRLWTDEIWSPNGNWILDTISTWRKEDFPKIRAWSTRNPEQIIVEQNPVNYGDDLTIYWSPDNNNIFLFGANEGRAGWPFNRLVFLSFDKESQSLIRNSIYEFDEEMAGHYADWSPDSNKISVVILQFEEVYIFDFKGNLLKIISPNLSETQIIRYASWIDSNRIVVEIDDLQNSGHIEHEFLLVNVSDTSSEEILLQSTNYINILFTNPSGRSLMYTDKANYDDKFFYVNIIDLTSRKMEQSIQIYGSVVDWCISTDRRYISLLIFDEDLESRYLWIYDWENKEISLVQNVRNLLGWDENSQAIIIGSSFLEEPIIIEEVIP